MQTPLYTTNGFNRSAIMRAAWVRVREQIAYHRSLAGILTVPSVHKLLSAALKSTWRIARAQRAKAIEAARIASPEYQAELTAKLEARRAARESEEARQVSAWRSMPVAEREAVDAASLAAFAADLATYARPNA